MNSLDYDESPSSALRPRHPGVAILDTIGICFCLLFLSVTQHWTVTVYLMVFMLTFAASCLHHWLPHADWRHKLDHTMIFAAIAITSLPYWGKLFPFVWEPLGPILIGVVILTGTTIKIFSILPKGWSAILYGIAATPMFWDWQRFWDLIPEPWNYIYFIGVFLYAFQLGIYTFQWFNLYPNAFGFREVQHIVLLQAFVLHATTALMSV